MSLNIIKYTNNRLQDERDAGTEKRSMYTKRSRD